MCPFLVLGGLLAATPSPANTGQASLCRAAETAIVVDTTAHRLYLCARGAAERTFTVALGVSGVDKHRSGDNRTPLGSYPLGTPRASTWFHRFVPVAYPTVEQARAGFTGSAIGIHGPPRGLEGADRLRSLVATDWTAGCIAVETDDDIDAIVDWIDARGPRVVRLVQAARA